MFLSEMKEDEKKALFLELATCMCFADSIKDQDKVIENAVSKLKDDEDAEVFLYCEYLSREKIELLKLFAIELGLWDSRKDLFSLVYGDDNHAPAILFEKFLDELEIEPLRLELEDFENLDKDIEEDVMTNFSCVDFSEFFLNLLGAQILMVVREKESDKEVKEKLASILVNIGYTSISPALITNIVSILPEVQEAIIEGMVGTILNSAKNLSFTNKEKKSFLFELLRMAYSDRESDGELEENKIMLLNMVAAYFELSGDDFEELIASVEKINIASREAIDLINE